MDVKHPIRGALRLAALSSVLVAFAAVRAQAQQEILRAPDADQLEPAPVFEADASPELPQPAGDPYCPACASPDYWIVSSRHCCKDGGRCFTSCPLEYFHVGQNGARQPAHQQQFVDSLEPGAPVCIVVHGSFSSWEDVCRGSWDLYHWLRPADPTGRTHFVFYTWPSDSSNTKLLPVDFGVLGRISADHGFHLSRLISMIPPDRPLSLLGHSHGTRTISAALHLRAGGTVQRLRQGCAPDLGRRIRVVFVASAIDSHWLNPGERYGMALQGTEFLLNLTNREDGALGWYPYRRLFSNQALARTGFTRWNRQAMGQAAFKIAEMDVTPLIKSGHYWRYYVRHPQIANAIGPIIFYTDAPSPESVGAPSQAARQPSPMTTVPQRRTPSEARVRETFSHIGRTRPAGRM